MKRKIFTMTTFLLIIMVITGCSGSINSSMTSLDKEFNKYASDAAEEYLKKEADSYKTTTVKTGDLEYQYTLYNETLDMYEVSYIAKFDADNVEEDEWIEISVRLTAKTKAVESVDCSYWNVDTYEASYGAECDAISNSKEGVWYNVNLTDEEIEKVKENLGPVDSLELK